MQKLIFKINGMHCTACAMNIDGDLEDTDGIQEARTSYAKQVTEVTFDPDKVTPDKIIEIIQKNGYSAQIFSTN